MVIGPLVNTKHGISTGDILIADTQTILIPNFNYDGTGKGKLHFFSFIYLTSWYRKVYNILYVSRQ